MALLFLTLISLKNLSNVFHSVKTKTWIDKEGWTSQEGLFLSQNWRQHLRDSNIISGKNHGFQSVSPQKSLHLGPCPTCPFTKLLCGPGDYLIGESWNSSTRRTFGLTKMGLWQNLNRSLELPFIAKPQREDVDGFDRRKWRKVTKPSMSSRIKNPGRQKEG